MPDKLKDWSKFKNLTSTTKENLRPTEEFKKSEAIQNLYKIQDKVAKKDPKFASALEKEIKFIRYSK